MLLSPHFSRHMPPAVAVPSLQSHPLGPPFLTVTSPGLSTQRSCMCLCLCPSGCVDCVSWWHWLVASSRLVLGAEQGDPCPPGARRPTREARRRQSPCSSKTLSPAKPHVGPRALVPTAPEGPAALARSMPRACSLTHASSGGRVAGTRQRTQPPPASHGSAGESARKRVAGLRQLPPDCSGLERDEDHLVRVTPGDRARQGPSLSSQSCGRPATCQRRRQ